MFWKKNGNIKRLEELFPKLEWQGKIAEIKDRVRSVFYDEEMYAQTLKIVLGFVQSPIGVFGYLDKKQNWICPSMVGKIWNNCDVEDKRRVFPYEDLKNMSIWGRVYAEKKTICVNSFVPTPEDHADIRALIIVPIIYKDKLIGMIAVANKLPGYDKDDVKILEIIAKQIAPILNHRLQYQRMEQRLEEVERMNGVNDG